MCFLLGLQLQGGICGRLCQAWREDYQPEEDHGCGLEGLPYSQDSLCRPARPRQEVGAGEERRIAQGGNLYDMEHLQNCIQANEATSGDSQI